MPLEDEDIFPIGAMGSGGLFGAPAEPVAGPAYGPRLSTAPSSGPLPPPPVPGTPVGSAPAAAERTTDWYGEAVQHFSNLGIDVSDPNIQRLLNSIPQQEDSFNQNPQLFVAFLNGATEAARQSGLVTQTSYEAALEAAGFGTEPMGLSPELSGFTSPEFVVPAPPARGLAHYGIEVGDVPDYVVQPETGWIQFGNGVLVQPNAQLGDVNAVIYPAVTDAPGSDTWLRTAVPRWGADKVNEWRKRLIDQGYLNPASAKGPADATFLNALRQFQTVKYQNGGKPMALDINPEDAALPSFNFKQLQSQIRNDVRDQYERVYATAPTDDELQKWSQFIMEKSRELYKRGELAPSQATAEAEERFVERLEGQPGAQYLKENLDENTQLRDSILRAVMVTQGMSQ